VVRLEADMALDGRDAVMSDERKEKRNESRPRFESSQVIPRHPVRINAKYEFYDINIF
jgi:hypothetical protein